MSVDEMSMPLNGVCCHSNLCSTIYSHSKPLNQTKRRLIHDTTTDSESQ
ncbi:hypothetical protein SX4_3635 [Vibrio mimicus SX-4]|nr:hypothetical protein VII_003063 [Vibrio mimicus MB451]EGU18933.1 hypothetical protein SX4_3635 [Vibrio mimicus SX-4]